MASEQQPAVLCVQDGARLNYAIPRALAELGWLQGVFTDFLVRPHSIEVAMANLGGHFGSASAARMQERRCAEIEDRTRTFPLRSLWWKRSRRNFATAEEYYEWLSGKTAAWMLRKDFRAANVVHGFIRNLNAAFCATCRQRGLITIGDQIIAPAEIEEQELATQRQCWPGWLSENPLSHHRVVAVEEKTWAELDHITCASEYVRSGLIRCGVEANRISVLPYPAPDVIGELESNRECPKPLRVGFVGSVNLRKGAPIFLELARRISGKSRIFQMVGPVSVPISAVDTLAKWVSLTGPVPRSQVAGHLRTFDVFFFPSTCEGSASVVMEALAAGLPVVTTPNSGTVVQHGVEGFIHSPEDLDGMESSLRQLLEDDVLRKKLSRAARLRAKEYNLTNYGKGMLGFLPQLLSAPK